MNSFRIVVRSITYYSKFFILITLGVAIATIVVTGSILTGSSVPKSIEDIAIKRLGTVQQALVSPQLFTTHLVQNIKSSLPDNNTCGVLSLRGIIKSSQEITIPQTNILGVDQSFFSFYQKNIALNKRQVIVNQTLADDLQVKKGDSVIIYIYRESLSPHNSLFARKKMEENIYTVRAKISDIIDDIGMGSFRLDANPDIPRNIFIDQDWLASVVKKEKFINTILTSSQNPIELRKHLSFEDLGIYTKETTKYLLIQNKNFVFRKNILNNILQTTKDLNIKTELSSVYLLRNILNRNKSLHSAYATIAGFSGQTIPTGHFHANTWLQKTLGTEVDETIEIEYEISQNQELKKVTESWQLDDIVAMDHELISRDFIPDFDGLTNAETVQSWDVPFAIDLGLITSEDEEYWESYKATPKMLVPIETMQKLWGYDDKIENGWVTSVAVDKDSIAEKELQDKILAKIEPSFYGLLFRPLRQNIIQSAKGSTDFAGLFIGMNFFILVSALLLTTKLVKLYVASRANQIGIMCTQGFSYKQATQSLFVEGLVYSILGCLVGTYIGTLYAKFIIYMLTTSWVDAVGTSQLQLFVTINDLVIAVLISFCVNMVAIHWGICSLKKKNISTLLRGWKSMVNFSTRETQNHSTLSYVLLIISIVIYFCAYKEWLSSTIAFFLCGTLIMASCYFFISGLLGSQTKKISSLNYTQLIRRNLALHRERYLLIFILFCFASFILIAVAINQNNFSQVDTSQKDSGTGGFSLQLTTSLPFHYDLTSLHGRKELGFTEDDEKYFTQSDVYGFWFFRGEDISCLNLAKVKRPSILGVPDSFIERKGFATTPENPWNFLKDSSGAVIPAIGDANSVMWSLNSGLHKNYDIQVTQGQKTLTFVGLLHNSILASEILISQQNFQKIFPEVSTPSYYLIASPTNTTSKLKTRLQQVLGNYGVVVKDTPELLNNFIQVQNTYITTFMTLGGLGMFLGVFGLVVVVIYSLTERKSEFAIQRCLGMNTNTICRIVFAETSIISFLGLISGSISAFIAVYPRIISNQAQIEWSYVASILLGMLLLTLIVVYITTKSISRFNLISSLRQE